MISLTASIFCNLDASLCGFLRTGPTRFWNKCFGPVKLCCTPGERIDVPICNVQVTKQLGRLPLCGGRLVGRTACVRLAQGRATEVRAYWTFRPRPGRTLANAARQAR